MSLFARIPFRAALRYAFMRNAIITASVFLLVSCGEEKQAPAPKPQMSQQDMKKDLEFANKVDRKRETDEINQVVARHQWTMTTTNSGLRFMYLQKGTGAAVKPDDYARVKYRITLLDGTFCYSSDSAGSKEVHVGHDVVERGLHEALQLMHVGDKMRFILPSYLAHGLLGDGDKIPALATVVYEIELLSVR